LKAVIFRAILIRKTIIITTHDICIFIETKTDKYHILNIPDGFSYVAKNRKRFKHKSGGIVVVYRNNLKNHIKLKYLIMTFYWDIITLLQFFIEMLQYDWL
jgi:hypothetical protein